MTTPFEEALDLESRNLANVEGWQVGEIPFWHRVCVGPTSMNGSYLRRGMQQASLPKRGSDRDRAIQRRIWSMESNMFNQWRNQDLGSYYRELHKGRRF
jgi:hypothetical protein